MRINDLDWHFPSYSIFTIRNYRLYQNPSSNSFIARVQIESRKIHSESVWSRTRLSGIEAVRKIVETETQAKQIVEEANSKAKEILSNANEEAQRIRQSLVSEAEQRRAQILRETKEKAEAEARSSDVETDTLLENYEELYRTRKEVAAKKAVELVLGS